MTGWQKRATRVSLIWRDGEILWPTLPRGEGFRSHRDHAAERTNLKPEGLSYRNMARFCRGGFPWILLPFHNAQSRNEQRKLWPQLPQKSIFQECANAFWI